VKPVSSGSGPSRERNGSASRPTSAIATQSATGPREPRPPRSAARRSSPLGRAGSSPPPAVGARQDQRPTGDRRRRRGRRGGTLVPRRSCVGRRIVGRFVRLTAGRWSLCLFRSGAVGPTTIRGSRTSIRRTRLTGTRSSGARHVRFGIRTTSSCGQKSKPRVLKTTSSTRPFSPSANSTGTPSARRSSVRKSVRRWSSTRSVAGSLREPQGRVGRPARTSAACRLRGCARMAEIGPQRVPTRVPFGLMIPPLPQRLRCRGKRNLPRGFAGRPRSGSSR